MYPIDHDAAVQLLTECVRLPTVNPPGNEKLAADWLAEELKRKGFKPRVDDLGGNRANIVTGVADEETGALGAKSWVQAGGLQGVGAIVIGEPTNLEVYIAEKGACWLEITTYGKTAHGSMPDLGINAVMHMTTALHALARLALPFQPHPLFDKPTMNVGTIVGGNKTNVVPDRCTATIDMRTLPGMRHEAVLQEIR